MATAKYGAKMTKAELAKRWENRLKAAERVYQAWHNRFKIDALYSYYEGFQWLYEIDETNRPYVVNVIYSTIETKLPNLILDNPEFNLTPRPTGNEFNLEKAMENSQLREDALNFICSRKEFGFNDKHELAILDSFFGFGVLHSGYSDDRAINPQLNSVESNKIEDLLFCKHIPYDQFRVSSAANWDLSSGKWYGYYEWVSYERLKEYESKLKFKDQVYQDPEYDVGIISQTDGKIRQSEDPTWLVGPSGHCKIWYFWDFETMKFCMYAPEDATNENNKILAYRDFDHSGISILRLGKRRKGWYPYPPVWNWLSPQDEINDIAQTQKIHRKRFQRKYTMLENSMEPGELDKFLTGPDGTVAEVKRLDAIKAVENAPLDQSSVQALARSYDDMERVSGSSSERQQVSAGSRTTATQANIMNQAAQVRDSKDSIKTGNFIEDFARNVLLAIRESKGSFWILVKDRSEGLLTEVKKTNKSWKKIPAAAFRGEDSDIQLNMSSISPISQNKDKGAFMEFLALITQYPLLAFSPNLIREAAYRVGYKNSSVLQQFAQWAQLAAIGKTMEMQGQLSQMGAGSAQPQGAQPGQMAQQQVSQSTPPQGDTLRDLIFNNIPMAPQQ